VASKLSWHREDHPCWDTDKQRVIGGAPNGVFDLDYAAGQRLAGDWWHASDGDRIVGYGWLDITWGDAEILLAVDPVAQRQGVGGFVLDNIEREAARRGVNYVYNTIRLNHPRRTEVRDWLESHGFRGSDADESLRKRVTATG
jgi:GNAT superfamily N-acetyltransferase